MFSPFNLWISVAATFTFKSSHAMSRTKIFLLVMLHTCCHNLGQCVQVFAPLNTLNTENLIPKYCNFEHSQFGCCRMFSYLRNTVSELLSGKLQRRTSFSQFCVLCVLFQLRRIKRSDATLAAELTPYNIVPLEGPSLSNAIGFFPEVSYEPQIINSCELFSLFFLSYFR